MDIQIDHEEHGGHEEFRNSLSYIFLSFVLFVLFVVSNVRFPDKWRMGVFTNHLSLI